MSEIYFPWFVGTLFLVSDPTDVWHQKATTSHITSPQAAFRCSLHLRWAVRVPCFDTWFSTLFWAQYRQYNQSEKKICQTVALIQFNQSKALQHHHLSTRILAWIKTWQVHTACKKRDVLVFFEFSDLVRKVYCIQRHVSHLSSGSSHSMVTVWGTLNGFLSTNSKNSAVPRVA